MSYQFIHIEMYARSASALAGKKRAKKGGVRESDGIRKNWNARQILAEALRETGACDHVERPQSPDVMHGDLVELAHQIDTEQPPKGQRKDTPILIAGVASAPWPPGDPRSAAWRSDVLEHLKTEFGDGLRAVIGHSDEQFDHVHFYVAAPDLAPVKSLHPGLKARKSAEAEGGDGMAAYNAAMKSFQDRYSLIVGQQHGQSRIGPGRQRVGRAEWIEHKQELERHAEAAQQVRQRVQQQTQLQAELDAQAQRLQRMAAITDKSRTELAATRLQLAAEARRIADERRDLDKEKALVQRMKEKLQEQGRAFLSVFNQLNTDLQQKLNDVFRPKTQEPPPLPVRQSPPPLTTAGGSLVEVLKNNQHNIKNPTHRPR